jgi:epidermal growth factor receptor substrate 15
MAPGAMRFEEPSQAPSGPPPQSIPAQNSGSIRVPPLTPDKIAAYTQLFETSGAKNGVLSGELGCNRYFPGLKD